jgi:hypothetical protein
VYLSQVIGWNDTLWALELGGEPPIWIAGWGNTCQALESCWWWRCWANAGSSVKSLPSHSSAALSMRHGRGVLPSHAGNGSVEVMLAVAWCRCWVLLAMVLPRLAGDGATETTLPVVWCHLRSYAGDGVNEVTLAVAWCRCRWPC